MQELPNGEKPALQAHEVDPGEEAEFNGHCTQLVEPEVEAYVLPGQEVHEPDAPHKFENVPGAQAIQAPSFASR